MATPLSPSEHCRIPASRSESRFESNSARVRPNVVSTIRASGFLRWSTRARWRSTTVLPVPALPGEPEGPVRIPVGVCALLRVQEHPPSREVVSFEYVGELGHTFGAGFYEGEVEFRRRMLERAQDLFVCGSICIRGHRRRFIGEADVRQCHRGVLPRADVDEEDPMRGSRSRLATATGTAAL